MVGRDCPPLGTCESCGQDLVLQLDPDDFDEATSSVVGGSPIVVPDDLELPCSCHFHWQCLLDESSVVALSLKCPSCHSILVSSPPGPSATKNHAFGHSQSPQILTHYINEGGVQNNLDILPLITEEAFLEANPSARPARALMHMCIGGDLDGIFGLLQAVEEDREDRESNIMSLADLLRYQDPLDDMKTALHVAIENNRQEIVWLLLWLASDVSDLQFPEEVVRMAESINASRNSAANDIDIRSLRNAQGWTARDLANDRGGVWSTLLQSGIL